MSVKGHRIAALVPARNEERQIGAVLDAMPDFVDDVLVINDASTDGTVDIVRDRQARDRRIRLVTLEENRGVGGALAEGYTWARDAGVDIAVTVDGDGQMDPAEIIDLVGPIVDGLADYTKGNRLTGPESWAPIPLVRLLGNGVLSLLTKIVSGYWNVADSQTGFTAASRYALEQIDWSAMYSHYGRPNDVLIMANVAGCRVADVPITARYGIGEQSSMRIVSVTFAISWLLVRRFWWRLWHKYVLRDFHPLVFFYLLSTVMTLSAVGLFVRLVVKWVMDGFVPQMTAVTLAFFSITALQSVFFAMWMDMESNKDLAVRLDRRRAPAAPTATRTLEVPATRRLPADSVDDVSVEADEDREHERLPRR
jgi:glycosyltransferase involved in cell wall biosynthesis